MDATIRYAQCWEDADVLSAALDVRSDHRCLVIASAGDNALALLAGGPKHLIAIDSNQAQLAALEVRMAAYRSLDYDELLQFVGARDCGDRVALYTRCSGDLTPHARSFWDQHQEAIGGGILSAGRFEQYLSTFRTRVLPLVHSSATVDSLLAPKTIDERAAFFDRVWNNVAWRAAFSVFFSRPVMSRIGRDRGYFAYAREDLGAHLRARVRHALVDLDPAQNPYLHWILKGRYGDVLPAHLRPETVAAVRRNLDRIELQCVSLENFLCDDGAPIDRYALSDVFEYMDEPAYEATLRTILARSHAGSRLAYWNMLVPRSRPASLADRLAPNACAGSLHDADRAFFYRSFVVEDVR